MPEQPTNKAEELLQRHAKERRERGGDFALHPATRQLLQGEVARHYGAAAQTERRAGIAAWFTAWRSVSFAAVLVVVLGVGTWIASRPRGDSAEHMEFAKASPPPVPAPAISPANTPALADERLSTMTSLSAEKKLSEPTAPAIAPASPSPMRALKEEKLSLAKDKDAAQRPADSSVTPAAAAPTPAAKSEVMFFKSDLNDEVVAKQKSASERPVTNFVVPTPSDYGANSLQREQQTPAGAAQMLARNEGARRDSADNYQSRAATLNTGESSQVANNSIAQNSGPLGRVGFAGGNRAAAGSDASQAANNSYQQAPATQQPQAIGGSGAASTYSTQRQYANNTATYEARRAGEQQLGAAQYESETAPVLAQFSIEQIGNLVRVIDTDGSQYQGPLSAEESAFVEDRVQTKGAGTQVMRSRQSPTPRVVAFRATGTNRTLNQFIVVNGRLSAASADTSGSFTQATDRALTVQTIPLNPTLPATRGPEANRTSAVRTSIISRSNMVNSVEGTVRVGSSPERVFRAQRVSR